MGAAQEEPVGIAQVRRVGRGYELLYVRGGSHGSEAEKVVAEGTLEEVHRAIDLLYGEEPGEAVLRERVRMGRGRARVWERGDEGLEGVIWVRPTARGYAVLHGRAGIGDSIKEEVVTDGTLDDVHRAIDLLDEAGVRFRSELRERIHRDLGPPHEH